MNKKFFLTLLLIVLLPLQGFAYTAPETGFYDGPSGQALYYTKGDHMAQDYPYIGALGSGGGGGSATATATSNNKQKQAQGQIQLQGQVQGQKQGQAIVDSGNNNAFIGQTIINEKPDRGLINPPTYSTPSLLEYRGPYDKGVYQDLKPWEMKKTWTEKDLAGMPACFFGCGDVTTLKYIDREPSKSFDVAKATNKPVVGVVLVEGEAGDTPIHVWRSVVEAALAMGGTDVILLKEAVTFANKASGWNIGLGGGVSATNNGADNYGGSVGGGTGVGSCITSPIEKIKVVFTIH